MKKGQKQTPEHIAKRTIASIITKSKRIYVSPRKGLTKENCESIKRQAVNMTKEKVKLICLNCGKEFYLIKWQSKNRKYCSKECRFTPETKEKMRSSSSHKSYKQKLIDKGFSPEEINQKVKHWKDKIELSKINNPEKIKGGKSKFYLTLIGKVQGTYELAYVEQLLEKKETIPIVHPKGIKTPYGIYFPDFEYEDKFIEIKSPFTYLITTGKIKDLSGNFTNIQWLKICWTNDNIKPVKVLIGTKRRGYISFKDYDIIGNVI